MFMSTSFHLHNLITKNYENKKNYVLFISITKISMNKNMLTSNIFYKNVKHQSIFLIEDLPFNVMCIAGGGKRGRK